jgi:hypothetical protein
MPKTDARFDPSEYALVADRIALFYERHPTGRIVTELHSRTEREVTFRALVFRAADDTEPAATGWASEREGDGEVNSVACLENTETSAIGRALANLGFTASLRRPSAEEMAKAARVRLVRERAPRPLDEARQRRADAVADVLDLLARAEGAGLPPARAAALRGKLGGDSLPLPALERIEVALRGWLARRERSL